MEAEEIAPVAEVATSKPVSEPVGFVDSFMFYFFLVAESRGRTLNPFIPYRFYIYIVPLDH